MGMNAYIIIALLGLVVPFFGIVFILRKSDGMQ